MATKRFRTGKWRYVIKRAGLLSAPVNLSFDSEQEGDEYTRRLEALLDKGIVPDELAAPQKINAKRLRVRSREYLATQHIKESDRNELRLSVHSLAAGIELRDLTFKWASEWITSMKREANLSPTTVRHRVGALARCLDWLTAHGEMTANPLRMLPKGYAIYTPEDAKSAIENGGIEKSSAERDRRLEPGEEKSIRKILAGEKPEGRQRALTIEHADGVTLLFDMVLESGMRLREMYTLDEKQVDLKRKTIFLDKTKNGSKRQVPISSVLHARLSGYKARYSGRLFPWWNGSHDIKELRRVTSLLSRQFTRIFDAAGCGDLHEHDLRHEATSRLYERTKLTDLEIAKILGWKNLRQAIRYANLRGSNLANKLW